MLAEDRHVCLLNTLFLRAMIEVRRLLTTVRLDLIPATAPLLRAEIEDPCLFFHQLRVHAIEDWPPQDLGEALPLFREQLERDPDLVGWLSWYWVLRPGDAPDLKSGDLVPGPPALAILIGSGGFKGRPEDDAVEIGYHVREGHRRRGYATEALRALLTWAFVQGQVRVVTAETSADNAASVALLEKLGFARTGDGSRPGLIRFASRGVPR
jgi:RimJ/RimL family protein N-acetyltransferase